MKGKYFTWTICDQAPSKNTEIKKCYLIAQTILFLKVIII